MNLLENLSTFNRNYFFLLNFSNFGCFLKKILEFFLNFSRTEPKINKPRGENRYNFASLLGGSKILEKNPDCLYDKSVLDDNIDKFLFKKVMI